MLPMLLFIVDGRKRGLHSAWQRKYGQTKKQGSRIDLCVMHLFLMGKEIFLKLFVLIYNHR